MQKSRGSPNSGQPGSPTPNQGFLNCRSNSIAKQAAAHFWRAFAHALQQGISPLGEFIFFARGPSDAARQSFR